MNSQLTNANTTINQKNTEIANLTNQVNTLINQNAILSQISTSLTRWLTQLEQQQRTNEAEKLLKLKLSSGNYRYWAEKSILTLTQLRYLNEYIVLSGDLNIEERNKKFWNVLCAKCGEGEHQLKHSNLDYETINKIANYLKSIGIN